MSVCVVCVCVCVCVRERDSDTEREKMCVFYIVLVLCYFSLCTFAVVVLLLQSKEHCYYQGHIRGKPSSSAALSSCDGFR